MISMGSQLTTTSAPAAVAGSTATGPSSPAVSRSIPPAKRQRQRTLLAPTWPRSTVSAASTNPSVPRSAVLWRAAKTPAWSLSLPLSILSIRTTTAPSPPRRAAHTRRTSTASSAAASDAIVVNPQSYTGSVSNAVLEFSVAGSSLTLLLNGTVVASATSSSITTAGAVGILSSSRRQLQQFQQLVATVAANQEQYRGDLGQPARQPVIHEHPVGAHCQ